MPARRPPGEPLPPIDRPESAFPSRRQYLNARAQAAGYPSYSAWLRARREAGIAPRSGPAAGIPERPPEQPPKLTSQQRIRAQTEGFRQYGSLEDVRRGRLTGPSYFEPRPDVSGRVLQEYQRRWAFSRLKLLWATGQLGRAAFRQLWQDLHAIYRYRDLLHQGFPGMTAAQVERQRARVRKALARLRAGGVLPPERPDRLPLMYH